MFHTYKLGLAGALFALASAAPAAQLIVANPDFEEGIALADGGYLAGHVLRIPGWSDSGGSGTGHWNPTSGHFEDEAAHGLVGFALGNGTLTEAGGGTLAQRIANHAIQANTRYTLSFDVGRPFGTDPWNFSAGLLAGSLAGGPVTLLSSFSGAADSTGALVPMGQFRTMSLVYETGANGPELGRDLSIAITSNQAGAAFDNFLLDASPLVQSAVPEPGTWAMMIAGFGLVGGALRRRRPQRLAVA